MRNTKKSIHPKAQAKFRQALALHEKGQLSQAQALYYAALELDALHAESIHHLGIIALQSNDISLAIELIERSLNLAPDNPAALNNLGMALEDSQQAESALKAYDHALSLDPGNTDANINRGNVLQTLQRWEQALSCYENLIARMPNNSDAYNNRGNVLRALMRHDQAIKSFEKAISLRPDFAQAWNNRAIALKDLKKFDEALKSCDRAIQLNPGYAEAYSNRGLVLKELGQFELALKNIDQAIKLKPNYAQAFGNRGGIFQELKKYELAYKDYDHAISLNPDIPALHGKRIHMQMHMCEWIEFNNRLRDISTGIECGYAMADPFTMLGVTDSPELQKKSAEIAIRNDYPFNPVLGQISTDRNHPKIRIGYFSADFRNHPVSYLMAELFEKHDKSMFEIFAFNVGKPTIDPMQQRVTKAVDQFIESGHQSDPEIAQYARSLNLDIAVDLGGFTVNNRPGVFAFRAAPVQIGYIGYLGTMGTSYYDYIIADRTLIPPEDRTWYAEKILYLNSYQANDSQRKISGKRFTRAELNLPPSGFVFCCFNNNYKFIPATFESWMRILQSVPGSVLYLYAEQEAAQLNLRKEACLLGVEPERLIFGSSLPREEYLARYKSVDLFLDTLPYNAGTTASDALWAGLPVLTCSGQSLASRMAASLLNAIELPELITNTYSQYEALAIRLATDTSFYQKIKEKLQRNIPTTALFDSESFCKDIEKAYMEVCASQRCVQ
jgi:predicted O-linked N-acetylglucosamine transferase (SPINDLY family)